MSLNITSYNVFFNWSIDKLPTIIKQLIDKYDTLIIRNNGDNFIYKYNKKYITLIKHINIGELNQILEKIEEMIKNNYYRNSDRKQDIEFIKCKDVYKKCYETYTFLWEYKYIYDYDIEYEKCKELFNIFHRIIGPNFIGN